MSFRMGLRPVVVCCVLVAASRFAAAQTTPAAPAKIAVVNLQAAVFGTAETKKANDEMTAKFKPRQDAIDQLNREIQALSNQLQTQQGKLTEQAYADITAQGQRKQRELQRAQDDLQADATAFRNDTLQKLSQKMSDVIKKLAEARGYDLVVEATTAIYWKPALDITKDAIGEYDKAYPVK